jgi:hypothetical protein
MQNNELEGPAHFRRRFTTFLVGLGLAAAAVLASTGTASADESTPPANATAAPSTSLVAAVGDSGQQYWATDACHYYAQGGRWFSDQCALAGQNSTIDLYQNEGDGRLGAELVHVDLSDPQWIVLTASAADGTPRSLRQATSDPTHVQTLGTTIDGRPIWVDVPKQSTTTVGGNSTVTGPNGGWVDTPAQAQYWQQLAQLTQSQQDRITCTIGCVHVVN